MRSSVLSGVTDGIFVDIGLDDYSNMSVESDGVHVSTPLIEPTTDVNIHRLVKRIDAVDLTKVRMYLINRQKMDPHRVDVLIREYRRYLVLCVVNPKTRKPISREVDEVWHSHIMFTRDYTTMGNDVFGRYFHHKPAITEEECLQRGDLYEENTRKEYLTVFGHCADQWFFQFSDC